CESACTFIRNVLLADEDSEWTAKIINLDEARCSRLDLFLDWQAGWHPTFEDGDERQFIKRVHAAAARYSVMARSTAMKSANPRCARESTTKPSRPRRRTWSGIRSSWLSAMGSAMTQTSTCGGWSSNCAVKGSKASASTPSPR